MEQITQSSYHTDQVEETGASVLRDKAQVTIRVDALQNPSSKVNLR